MSVISGVYRCIMQMVLRYISCLSYFLVDFVLVCFIVCNFLYSWFVETVF